MENEIPQDPSVETRSSPRTPRPSRRHDGHGAPVERLGHHDEAAARGGRPLRPPDQALEPEDEAVHLRRPQRHLHHRPPEDGRPGPHRLPRSSPTWWPRAAPCSSWARRSRPRTPSARRPAAAGMYYVTNRWLGGTLTNFKTVEDRHRPAQDHREDEDRRHLRAAPQEGGRLAGARAREAREEPGRHQGHGAAARRPLRDRHEEGVHRGPRGQPARHPGGRDRRHQLRPRAASTSPSRATTTPSAPSGSSPRRSPTPASRARPVTAPGSPSTADATSRPKNERDAASEGGDKRGEPRGPRAAPVASPARTAARQPNVEALREGEVVVPRPHGEPSCR